MRKEITEAQITELMRAIPRAEEVDRLRADNERLRAERDAALAVVARMKKLLRPLADLPWPTREEDGR